MASDNAMVKLFDVNGVGETDLPYAAFFPGTDSAFSNPISSEKLTPWRFHV